MDAFNIEKLKIRLNHESRGRIQDIGGWTSGNFIFLGQEKNRSGLLQVKEIFGDPP